MSEEKEKRAGYERRVQTHEPAPTGDGIVILDYAVRHVEQFAKASRGRGNPSLADSYALVRTALIARAEMGKAKYGTYLRAANGRNASVDLYQELLDAIMYSEQCDVELLAAWETDSTAIPTPELKAGAGMLMDLINLAARIAPYIEKVGL